MTPQVLLLLGGSRLSLSPQPTKLIRYSSSSDIMGPASTFGYNGSTNHRRYMSVTERDGIKAIMVDYDIPYNPWAEEDGTRSPITKESVSKVSKPDNPIKKASLFFRRIKRTGTKELEAFNSTMMPDTRYDNSLSPKFQNNRTTRFSIHSRTSLSSLPWGSRKGSVSSSYSPQSKSAQKILQLTGFDPSYDATPSWAPSQEYAESSASSLSSGSVYSQDENGLRSDYILNDQLAAHGRSYTKPSRSSLNGSGSMEGRSPQILPRVSSLRHRERTSKRNHEMEEEWVDSRKSRVVDDRIAEEMARYKECFLPEIWEETLLKESVERPIVYPPEPHPGDLCPHPLVVQKPLFGIKSSKRFSDVASETPSSPLASARDSVVSQIRHMSAFLMPKSNRESSSSSENGSNKLMLVLPPPPLSPSNGPERRKKSMSAPTPPKRRFSLKRNQKASTPSLKAEPVSTADCNITSPLLLSEREILDNTRRYVNGPDTPRPRKHQSSSSLGYHHAGRTFNRETDNATTGFNRIDGDQLGKTVQREPLVSAHINQDQIL
ncbi:hypothetical protein F5884DRAFT_750574 [Xylogone sp. PMI_703]|nr:hypothetical protein F5884DRAFT_750574 [Xylogone sp. PMI_703]